jgi:hypothetical protein
MGTSWQPEPKLGTGPQLTPDSEPELQNSLHGIFGSSFFLILKKKFKVESCLFPLPDWGQTCY